jgi:hypothetical protein
MTKMMFDTRQFNKEMSSILSYSEGFIEGTQKGKIKFFTNIGEMLIESAKSFIDTTARLNPAMLHHVYEWSMTGSPDARLYDVNYVVNNRGISFSSSFSQSRSIKDGSSKPFYDKARIMELGIPVRISPVNSSVLVFDDNGEQVFTKGPVTVQNPGGDQVQGGFEKVFDQFFMKYFTQAFLQTSGISQYLKNPVMYKSGLKTAKTGGKSKGISVGYKWIAGAGAFNG